MAGPARTAVLVASLLWAGFWLSAAAVTLDPSSETPFRSAIVFALCLGVLPVLPIWLGAKRRERVRRRTARLVRPMFSRRGGAESEKQRLTRLRGLHVTSADDWSQLLDARELVGRLADGEAVDERLLEQLDERIENLGRLLEVDGRSVKLGGIVSKAAGERAQTLKMQLLALADAAVDYEAAKIGGEAPNAVTDALERLTTQAAAIQELGDLV